MSKKTEGMHRVAKLRELRVPFGVKDMRLYAPDEVPKGLACECKCPGCDARLVANHPKDKARRRAYFSHYETEECSGGFESALHKMAIQLVHDAGWIRAPGKAHHDKTHIAGNYYESWTISLPEQSVTFEHIVYEKSTINGLRPDLTGTLMDGTEVYIEVFVTHAVEEFKARTLDNLMEIDLSSVSRDQVTDVEKLMQIVLKSAPRRWYRSSWMDKRMAQSAEKLELDKKHRRDRERYLLQLTAASAERRKQAEFVAALDEKRRIEREPFMDDLRKAMRLAEPGKVYEFRERVHEKCARDIGNTQKLMESFLFTQFESPVHGSEVITRGDWVVKTHPLIWKAYVMKEFILMAPLGSSFTAGRIANEVQKWFGYWPWMERLAELKRRDNDRLKTQQPRLLSEEEAESIILPVEAMAAFLDRLSGRPYGYLERLRGYPQYIVRYQDAFSLQAKYFAELHKARQASTED